ncbi:hypothetical protein [Parasitella parasitica]|uniref:Ras-associating domain-containing protein n=1 Tax=Parasitella parasitica TaxID=35722 RepID=A0A0B7N4U9_9FUNG|nr:hypothetical protein [Parasitella parasitica]
MTLLDDSNSYWWLIRALKASEVGYIPAENIETPFERLARLNKHRNTEVTSLDQLQHFQDTAPPPKKFQERKTVKVSRELACQVQIILTDQDDESLYQEEFENWQEDMSDDSYNGVSAKDDDSENDDYNDKVKAPKSNKKKDNKKKFTPLLNPDFNKSINAAPALETATTTVAAAAAAAAAATPCPEPTNSTPAQTTVPPPLHSAHDKPLPPTIISEEPAPLLAPSSNTLDLSISAAIPEEEPTIPTAQQTVVTGLKRLLSIGKKNKPPIPQASISNSDSVQDTQYHVLRIFAGNINVGAMFSTVAVTPGMNADQLLKLALQKFHIPLLDGRSNKSNDGIEYYLTVKSMDGDEITLRPQDKPLAIFESLNDHLTTPMPSLTYIKRLSMEQPTIKVTRVGVSKARQRAKARFGEDSVIRFSLHKRIKRNVETGGQIHVKLSYYAENKKRNHRRGQSENKNKISTVGLIRKSSLLRVGQQAQQQQQQQQALQQKAKQERIDKLVAVSTTTLISDLKITALEKFHLINEDASLYYVALSVNGLETPLSLSSTIAEVLGDTDLIPKLFVLRKKSPTPDASAEKYTNTSDMPSTESTNSRRFMSFRKQNRVVLETSTSSSSVTSSQSAESNTGSVLRRLDQAIQAIENDKRQLVENLPVNIPPQHQQMRMSPIRSNSLSAMTNYSRRLDTNNNFTNTKLVPNQHYIDSSRLPKRSSSLRANSNAFEKSQQQKKSLANMDDLQGELTRIASSHQSYPLQSAQGM